MRSANTAVVVDGPSQREGGIEYLWRRVADLRQQASTGAISCTTSVDARRSDVTRRLDGGLLLGAVNIFPGYSIQKSEYVATNSFFARTTSGETVTPTSGAPRHRAAGKGL